jgi:hypothetical protein
MKLSRPDHDFALKACADPRSTEEEKDFLSYMASMYAANEPITKEEYSRLQRLTGGFLSPEPSIFERDAPPINTDQNADHSS